MEYFIKPRAILATQRIVALVLGLIDFWATLYLLFNHILQIPLSTGLGYVLILNWIHAFSWMGAIITYYNISISFGIFYSIAYITAFLFDLGAFIIRLVSVMGCAGCSDETFQVSTTIVSGVLVVQDAIHAINGLFLLFNLKRWVNRIRRETRTMAGSNVAAGTIEKMPFQVYFSRLGTGFLWNFDLFITIIIGIIFALGLSVSTLFGTLILFQSLHLFSWLLGRSIAGTPNVFPSDAIFDPQFITVIYVIYVLDVLLGIASFVWRGVLLVDCALSSTASCDTITLIFSWITEISVIILTGMSVGSAIFIRLIYENLYDHYRSVLPILHLYHPNSKILVLKKEFRQVPAPMRLEMKEEIRTVPGRIPTVKRVEPIGWKPETEERPLGEEVTRKTPEERGRELEISDRIGKLAGRPVGSMDDDDLSIILSNPHLVGEEMLRRVRLEREKRQLYAINPQAGLKLFG